MLKVNLLKPSILIPGIFQLVNQLVAFMILPTRLSKIQGKPFGHMTYRELPQSFSNL